MMHVVHISTTQKQFVSLKSVLVSEGSVD